MTAEIVKRDLSFDLSSIDLTQWHPYGPQVSHYFNVQSLLFPEGECFFIRSVRRFRDQIDDPELQAQITGFIGQEAVHGREHENYNKRLAEVGYQKEFVEKLLRANFKWLERWVPAKFLLALTVAMEHITAIAAEDTLRDERAFDGAPEPMKRLWIWHALEESEHKAVAFDVYSLVAGTRFSAWFWRCLALVVSSCSMQLIITLGVLRVSLRHGDFFQLRGWWQFMKFAWGKPGYVRQQIPRYFLFFSPKFHPWDLDNSADIDRCKSSFSYTPKSDPVS